MLTENVYRKAHWCEVPVLEKLVTSSEANGRTDVHLQEERDMRQGFWDAEVCFLSMQR